MKNLSRKHIYVVTVLDLLSHLTLTLVLALIFFKRTGNVSWAVMCFVGGILIDTDHFLDYGLYYGTRISFSGFFGRGYLASGKVYLVFHSWELVFLLWVVGIFYNLFLPLAAGMALHLFTDMMISHRSDPRFLFLFHRWKNGFSLKKMVS